MAEWPELSGHIEVQFTLHRSSLYLVTLFPHRLNMRPKGLPFTSVVCRAPPFHWTAAPETKFDPFTVRVKAGPPRVALLGEILAIAGTGFDTTKELLPPPQPNEMAVRITAVRHSPKTPELFEFMTSPWHRSRYLRISGPVLRVSAVCRLHCDLRCSE